jgi:poly(A) polymerase
VTILDPAQHSWMRDARTQSVMRALTREGGEARFVGGAVRNALIGAPVTDVDIATPLVPEEVVRRLQAAGLNAVPTGIEHGTITAIADKTPYEVTTLRRDVSTDGRRAVVAFTTDWKEDAGRRDFTMNALYADETGRIFDYFGGIEDLRLGRVRFIGDAKARIREDYLRILRFFRFHAWYGKGAMDSEALASCAAEKVGIRNLSAERIQKEMLRLLEAKDPMPALVAMEGAGILDEVVPGASVERLRNLAAIQRANDFPPDALLRLASLMPGINAATALAKRLRLSNSGRDRMLAAVEGQTALEKGTSRASLYRMGALAFRDAVMLRWAASDNDTARWREMEALSRDWTPPKFPLDGSDVKALGMSEGPRVGALLHELEQEWIAEDFKPGREELLARLKAAVQ